MNTFQNKHDSIEKLIFDEGLKIKSLEINSDAKNMHIYLNNNTLFIISLSFYPGLKNAPLNLLQNFKLIANGTGIHWLDLDEDLSLKGFFKDFLKQKVQNGKDLVIA